MATDQRDEASPDLPGIADNPGKLSQQTTDFRPGPTTAGPRSGPAPAGSSTTQPTAFGRYSVRSVLGTGGFATVYLGHDTQLDRAVALKVLRGGPDLPAAEGDPFPPAARRLAPLALR